MGRPKKIPAPTVPLTSHGTEQESEVNRTSPTPLPTPPEPPKLGPATDILVEQVLELAQKMTDKKFYPYQEILSRRICKAVIDREGTEITGLLSRQAGKTECVADTAASLMIVMPQFAIMWPDDPRFNMEDARGRYRGYKNGFLIGIYAPIQKQASITYDRVRSAFEQPIAQALLSELGLVFTASNGGRCKLSNGSIVVSISASEQSKIEGPTHNLALCDECQEIPDVQIKKGIHPMLAATKGNIVKIGTPNLKKCEFHYAIERNKAKEVTTGNKYHFEFPYDVCANYNSLYKEYVEGEKERLGEESDEFRQAYKLEWILERGMFITKDKLETLLINEKNWKGRVPDERYCYCFDEKHTGHHVMGIDFGKKHDSTVATIMEVDWENPLVHRYAHTTETMVEYATYKKHVLKWLELYGDDYSLQFDTLVALVKQFNIEKIRLDSTGLGEVLKDRFVTEFTDIVIEPMVFSAPTISEGYKTLSVDISSGRLTLPGGDGIKSVREWRKFVDQMLILEKNYKNEYMVCHAPEDEKNVHDDYPTSLMLANGAAGEPAFSLEAECSKENFLLRRGR